MSDILGEKDICNKCGKCCRLIYSQKSYEELCEDAKNADNVAINFLKLFLPYESEDEVLKIDANAVNAICMHNKKIYGGDCKTYFYHCRYIGIDNSCMVYDMRPKFCRQYPKNEFIILPDGCAYEGYSFLAREKVKAKVRKAKEQLLDVKVMRQNANDRATVERLKKIEKKNQQFIEQYKIFGSEDW